MEDIKIQKDTQIEGTDIVLEAGDTIRVLEAKDLKEGYKERMESAIQVAVSNCLGEMRREHDGPGVDYYIIGELMADAVNAGLSVAMVNGLDENDTQDIGDGFRDSLQQKFKLVLY